MDAKQVGTELVNLCREGRDREAIEKFYHADVVCSEPMGENPQKRGIDEAYKSVEMFQNMMEVHSGDLKGPFPHGNQFTTYANYDVTEKQSGNRFNMEEVALYTVEDGKITEAKFYYDMG
ncbi:MAG: nuclear transport factor 2 family protein [Armatimonadetes bacterium]|nr:nuclear transport factor 2 family protein [Armatimonadota bacterium]